MNLDDLSRSVTDAILRAESLPPCSWDAQALFREVSEIEEAIAAIVGAKDVEGEIARLGAVSAALSAGEALRAMQLAVLYLRDDLSDSSRSKLEELLKQADAEIESAAADGPNVLPVTFRLRAA
jgi:hypothetical protein